MVHPTGTPPGHPPLVRGGNSIWGSLRLGLGLAVFLLGVSAILHTLLRGGPGADLAVAIGYLIWESSLTLAFLIMTLRAIHFIKGSTDPAPSPAGRRGFPGLLPTSPMTELPAPSVSVLIAAYNEASCILETIRSVQQQEPPPMEIMVASDGSTDGMDQLLIRELGLQHCGGPRWEGTLPTGTRLIVLVLERRGKGHALNSALVQANGEVIVTLDADTGLELGALRELARPFQDPRTAAAGGFIFIRNTSQHAWITRQQYIEYLKNFLYRLGLAQAQICLQVSGAFGAFRRHLLQEVGGFSPYSLVEDYEIIYRFHCLLRERRQDYRITVAPLAIAYTDGPESLRAFIRQRTRWFAGFLQTLWEYRFMIGNPRYGRIGLVMLPIKSIDAVLPLWGLGSLLILTGTVLFGTGTSSLAALFYFGAKWVVDLILTLGVLSLLPLLLPGLRLALSRGRILIGILNEGIFFHWFRQAAVLNAYHWVVRRIRHWDQDRWKTAPGALTSQPLTAHPGNPGQPGFRTP